MLSSLRVYDKSAVAQKRLEIIQFYDEYGEAATKQAFGADRKVISRWKLKLKKSGGKLQSLVPRSTKPKQLRQPVVNPLITQYIREQREAHYRIGKDKLKPDLDIHCLKTGIMTVSTSTIGNIIKRNHFFYQPPRRTYHDPNSAWATRRIKKTKRLRVKHSPKPTDYGYIVSDAVERITNGVKDYFISAIDAKGKFALTLMYKRLNARNMQDFYFRFKSVYPYKEIRIWQSDNGSENLGIFNQQLATDGIPHYFIYPRCPKIDTFIERYNRTIQDEFIDPNLDLIHDKQVFAELLVEWIIYYNTKRRHHSLGLQSPLQSFINSGGMSQMSLTYTLILLTI
jgi:transposase InsO family protein